MSRCYLQCYADICGELLLHFLLKLPVLKLLRTQYFPISHPPTSNYTACLGTGDCKFTVTRICKSCYVQLKPPIPGPAEKRQYWENGGYGSHI